MAQSKAVAIRDLMREARSERAFTQTSIGRIGKACRALELNRADTIAVFCYLDACDNAGKPYRAGYKIPLPDA